jgi:putative FmdB family regulatory protein
MPIYEYRCKKCGVISEFFVNVGKSDEISCKNCGSVEMEKVICYCIVPESFCRSFCR